MRDSAQEDEGKSREMEFSGCTNSRGKPPPHQSGALPQGLSELERNPQVRTEIMRAGRNLGDDGVHASRFTGGL